MELIAYLLAFQLLCGSFACFLAARRRRSRLAWFAVGTLVPVLGVLLALRVKQSTGRRSAPGPGRKAKSPSGRSRPRRCSGSYIPECHGCPHFARPLFDATYGGSKKGHCGLFGRDLYVETEKAKSRVVLEE